MSIETDIELVKVFLSKAKTGFGVEVENIDLELRENDQLGLTLRFENPIPEQKQNELDEMLRRCAGTMRTSGFKLFSKGPESEGRIRSSDLFYVAKLSVGIQRFHDGGFPDPVRDENGDVIALQVVPFQLDASVEMIKDRLARAVESQVYIDILEAYQV